jgi:membrane-bound inhibitor of C-type lysozyme
MDFKQKVHCGTCYDRCAARYKCHRHKVSVQRCHYLETELKVIINGDNYIYANSHISVGPVFQSPYVFWRNDTTTILNTAFDNFLEGTNFNYSCIFLNSPKCKNNFILFSPITLNVFP